MGSKGFYVSKTVAVILVVVVIVLLVAEGLLVGLVGRPTCSSQDSSDSPTTTTPVKTTTVIEETTTAAEPEGPWNNPRLPENLKPIDYTVSLRPDVLNKVEDTYWFYGSSSVRYMCMNSTNYVILHSITLIFADSWSDYLKIVDVEDGSEQVISDVSFYTRYAYMVVTLESACVEGRTYEMSFSQFSGELGNDLDGLYRSEYVNEFGKLRVIATTQMQVDGARQTFPCFDEPAFKANFTITLYHRSDQNYTAISNMPPVSWQTEDIDEETWNSTLFYMTPTMSTYLLAMVVSDFSSEEAFTKEGIQTRIYARSVPVENGEVTYAANVSPDVLDVLAEHYKVAYPLPKSDQMAVPDFGAGAMENWGLVIYREVYLLFDPMVSSVYNKFSVVQVIAHELAHQWFGNLVTAEWWNDLWLNEGFASYVQYIGVEGVHPDWKLDELFIVGDLQGALSSDAYSSSHPLHHPEISFSTITYSKGASFLRMVNDFLGNDTFTNALTKYLEDRKYDVANYNDLFKFWIEEADLNGLTDSFPAPLQEILETWVLQMGYPLLTVSKTGNTVTVTQEHFLIDEDDSPVSTPGSEIYNYKWYVPFTYKSSSQLGSLDPTTYQWMNLSDPITFDTTDDFVLANINAVGFYRVAYDDAMWGQIVNTLTSAAFTDISPQNRAQLIDDVFAVTRSGKVAVEAALDLTRYLEADVDYITWETFLNNMVSFDRLLASSNIYGEFSNYIVNLVDSSIYSEYGWEEADTSDAAQVERMARGIAIEGACHYGLPDCIQQAVALYQHWMDNPDNNTISTTYRRHVYCTAIRAGGAAEWEFAWGQYLAVDSAHEKSNLRYAMSCSTDSWIINRYIEYCLDDTLVRNQDVSATMRYIGDHEHSKYVAWSFAVNNWDRLMNTVGSGPTSSMLSAARRRFSTEIGLQLIDLLRPIASDAWENTLNSYYNSVVDNIAWREKNEGLIGNWLGGVTLSSPIDQTKPKTSITRFEDVDLEVIKEDRGFLKRF